MKNKLKSCPFCGGKGDVEYLDEKDRRLYGLPDYFKFSLRCIGEISCILRHVRGLDVYYETRQEAVDAWNRREDEG